MTPATGKNTKLYIPLPARVRNWLRHSPARGLYYAYHHREITPRDVLVAGFPRCGTTWVVFMLVELLWRAGKDHSIRESRYTPQSVAFAKQARFFLPNGGRLVRTHERFSAAYRRAICVVRDPRDAATSQFFQTQRTMGVKGSFSDFLPYFLRGTFSGAGTWDRYTESWLDSPIVAEGKALLLRYEDIQTDAHRELRRAAVFLKLKVTDADIERAVEAGRFDVMRTREKSTAGVVHREKGETIYAIRKGVSGDWRNHFSRTDLDRLIRAFGPTARRAGYELSVSDLDSPTPLSPAA